MPMELKLVTEGNHTNVLSATKECCFRAPYVMGGRIMPNQGK